MSDYTDTPTKVRVFFEEDHWTIDGIDDDDGYTEALWPGYDDGTGYVFFETKEAALARASEFAAEYVTADAEIVVLES